VRVFEFFDDTYVVKLNVQILIHALESSTNGDVVLQFDCYLGIDQSFEEAKEVSWLEDYVSSVCCANLIAMATTYLKNNIV